MSSDTTKPQALKACGLRNCSQQRLEWNIVILIIGNRIIVRSGRLSAGPAASGPAAAVTFSAQHLHFFAHDLGGIPVLAILVLPFTGLKPPFDIDCLPFGEILTGDLRKSRPEGDIVPFGLLLPLPALVLEFFGCRNRKTRDCSSGGCIADFRVLSQISYKHNFIQTGHELPSPCVTASYIFRCVSL